MAAIGHAPRSASHVLQLAMRAASAYPLELEPLERALLVLRRIFSKGGVLIVLAGILYVYLSKCARTVSTGQIGIVEQLGKFNRIATPGDPRACLPCLRGLRYGASGLFGTTHSRENIGVFNSSSALNIVPIPVLQTHRMHTRGIYAS